MAKKDERTVDKILSDIHKKKKGTFEERLNLFKRLHEEEDDTFDTYDVHAEEVVHGYKDQPGCYKASRKALDSIAAKNSDIVDNEDELMGILETYVDTFLASGPMGKKYVDIMNKMESKNLTKEKIRQIKGQLFAKYHLTDKGKRVGENILSKEYIKGLVGKKKIQIIRALRKLAADTQKQYLNYLNFKTFDGIFTEEDRFDLADHMEEQLKDKYELVEHPYARTTPELMTEYKLHLIGEDLTKHDLSKEYYAKKTKKRKPMLERAETAEAERKVS